MKTHKRQTIAISFQRKEMRRLLIAALVGKTTIRAIIRKAVRAHLSKTK